MKASTVALLGKVNLVGIVCDHVLSENHSHLHRVVAGVLVAMVGVLIAHNLGHSHNQAIAVAGDGVGYTLHGLGIAPILDWLIVRSAL